MDGRRLRFSREQYLIAAGLGLFVVLGLALIQTRPPWVDEGWFASPAINIVRHGTSGTTILESEGTRYVRMQERTFWVPPLHFVAQAAWYQCFGVSLTAMRTLSLFFGVVGLVSLYALGKGLGLSRGVTLLATVLCGTSFIYLRASADGRMDMMSEALALAGLASYVNLRTTRLDLAMLAGHAFIVASGLTHPHGILGWFSLMILIVMYDWRQITLRLALLAALPYVVGAAGWGAYIATDPVAFWQQFSGNIINRGTGSLSLVHRLWLEVEHRYLETFGFDSTAKPWSRLKLLVLLAYLATFAWAIGRRELRERRDVRFLASSLLVNVLFLAFAQGNLSGYYFVYLVPAMCLLMSICAQNASAGAGKYVVAGLLGAVVILQLASPLNVIRRNDYRRDYLPMIEHVRAEMARSNLPGPVVGSSELAFELGFEGQVFDDISLGYYSDQTPTVVVLGWRYERYARFNAKSGQGAHVRQLLSSGRTVFKNRHYTVLSIDGPRARLARTSSAVAGR